MSATRGQIEVARGCIGSLRVTGLITEAAADALRAVLAAAEKATPPPEVLEALHAFREMTQRVGTEPGSPSMLLMFEALRVAGVFARWLGGA